MDSTTDVTTKAKDLLFKLYNLKSTPGSHIKLIDIFNAFTDNSDEGKKEISYLLNDVLTESLKYLERPYSSIL